ncbi:FHA domain-containing protein [Actinomyces sp. 432]|uniref:FHA domain-containing protein n=2 Tax=unclassified Actinomyces TaxID=2609248 RepID=UPI001F4340FA|nr:FHA domain-containing protein [Actinomyces sp. 432]
MTDAVKDTPSDTPSDTDTGALDAARPGVPVGAGGLTDEIVSGRFGTAVLRAPVPAGVREQVLAALGGTAPAVGPAVEEPGAAYAATADEPDDSGRGEPTAERPDGTGLVETGVWIDPDYAPALPQTGVWMDTADEAPEEAPPPAGAVPEPGSGRRRRTGGSGAGVPAGATAEAPADGGDGAAGQGAGAVGPAAEQPDAAQSTLALQDAGGASAPEPPVPLIPAAMCAAGHPNPLDAVACQACAAPLTGEVRQVPRPVLAVLTFSTGQTVPVRGDVVVGRAPRPRPGQEAATQLVTVPSADHFVSRSHLEITVAGWSLLARDLGSANGTVLVRPGAAPVLLATALPTPLQVGDLLDVGDGVTLRVEPPL